MSFMISDSAESTYLDSLNYSFRTAYLSPLSALVQSKFNANQHVGTSRTLLMRYVNPGLKGKNRGE